VAKAIANLVPESNASQWQAPLRESPPAGCFQVDREILAAAHPWDCVRSALYESRDTDGAPGGTTAQPIYVFDSSLEAWGVAEVAPPFSVRYESFVVHFGPYQREAGMRMLSFARPVVVGVLLLPAL
jgi:hypothetical protein